ncbi:hypothetical protein PF010_g20321 [Phytophthora fragariae]|uniref:Uncharacterized protein n=1 Tax=Phytophthora fragariae TaxID=53985 RepID=A0A6A3SAD0_9STRA|nr:hypothetical protein PF003_g6160 [Phytophthora fragariae]KAE8987276.1 hypothetical protein PF011_g19644 [Phytophthora fragariae]KAE9085822.1 hypothetical protein PF010_g20321 [Phytophthora fragariae]KAE9113043.1 hypothetical protein PF006_g19845 [Phytophthora fragariae]
MFGGGTLSPDAAAQNPTSASARVVSCRFFCADCGGDARSIFRQEYSSLEQGGAKALRCFSHCCPSRQSSSSNCGSSLHLLVTFSSDATAFRQSDELVVCCRFEPVAPSVSVGPQSGPHTLSLSVGEMVVLPSAEPTSSLSSDNWLIGKQESELNRSEFPKNTIVYVFNGNRHRQPRWIFHEDDSARGLKFQLVAYVFRPRPRSYDQQFAGERLIYRALGVLSTVIYRFPSPVFTILAGGTVHEECGSVDPPCKLKCHEPLERGGKLKASFENTAATASSATTAFNLAAQPILQASHISHAWQLNHHISELSFSDKMLHLAIPLLFLEFTPFSAVGYFLVSRDNCTSSQRQGGSASAAQMTLWSTVQHQAAAASHVFDSSTEWFLPEDHEVVRESILLLLDVLTSSSIRQLTNSTFATAAATASVEIPTKLQFQQRFYDFVGNLYEAIVTLLRAREPEDSSLRISNLANKLLALIFKRAPFRPLRKVMSEMLLNRSLMPVIGALETFTAQLREVYVTYWKTIADQQSARHTLPLSLASSLKDAHLRCWNGRWVMDDDETRVVPYGNVASGGVLAWLLFVD